VPAALLACALSTLVRADEPPPPPPPVADAAELGIVITAGNSESKSLGFKNKFVASWGTTSSLEINAAAVRVESTTKSADASGDIHEDTTTTASSKMLNARYNHKISEHFYWFAGAGWERNVFAGFNSRYTGFGGIGNIWVDTDVTKFRTDYAVSWTKENGVIDDPAVDDSYAGARLSWAFLHKFGASTVYTNELTINENLDETSDFRADMTNAVAVAMSKKLALKVSLQWLYDHEPAIIGVPSPNGPVPDRADSLDTVFTASLVINF
jgi:putative salt-induced outer membrane protein YdiY